MTAQWLDVSPDDCEHIPNDRGTACRLCGIPAEMVTPDELADAMMAAHRALVLARAGQTSWTDAQPCPQCGALGWVYPCSECGWDAPKPSRCWQYLHTTGGTRRCMVEPDYHDGPHDFEPTITPMMGVSK